MPQPTDQETVNERNSHFWDELCGTGLARSLRISDVSAESLARFDAAYLEMYPYLAGYMPKERVAGSKVLEIGLGYGTLVAELQRRGAVYYGVDIARGPVEMARHRLELAQEKPEDRVVQGSALELPHSDNSFDCVYSIGCLHHTGDLPRAIAEVHRVLRPGGTAVVMLYNRFSLRRLRAVYLPRLWRHEPSGERVRRAYDANMAGQAAPHTDYVGRRQVRGLFAAFQLVSVESRNFDDLPPIPRARLLGNVDRVLGTDLYVTATG